MADSWEPIRLADVAPLRIGALDVTPSTLELRNGDTRTTIEPRVMQVLVTLAGAQGETVSRDELVARCWGGLIVGDNAVQRVISRIRELAATIGDNSFAIETIKRVGYRLIVHAPAHEPAPAEPAPATAVALPPQPARRWRLPIALGAVAVLLAVVLGLWLARPQASKAVVIEVRFDQAGETGKRLGEALALELMRARRTADLPVFFAGAARERAEFNLSYAPGVTNGAPGQLSLADRAGAVLWSVPTGDAPTVQALTGLAGASLFCAFGPGGVTRPFNAEAIRLFLALCERERVHGAALDPQQLEQLARLAPRSSRVAAWQLTATIDARGRYGQDNPPGWQQELRARMDALRAIAPDDPALILGEVAQLPSDRWAERLSLIERGIARQPGSAALHRASGSFLRESGELAAAVRALRTAVELDRFDVRAHHEFVIALAFSGFLDPARAALAEANQLWPGSEMLNDARFRIEWRLGDAATLLREVDRGRYVDSGSIEQQQAIFRNHLIARIDPTPERIEAALNPLRQGWERNPAVPFILLQSLGTFGRADEAITVINHPESIRALRGGPEILFRSYMKSIRHHPRFMAAMARIGLAQFWRARGNWPDFCAAPDLPYDCRQAAGAALDPR